MSYILDALRRADNERDRGSVPTVHARAASPGLADPGRGQGGFPLLRAALGAALLAALALLGWRALERGDARDAGGALPAPAGASSTAPAMSAPGSAPAAAPAAATALAPAPTPASAIETNSEPVGPATPPVTSAAAGRATLEPIRAPKKVDKPAPPAESPPVRAPAAESRIDSPTELPADVQRNLPRLVVGGASYSDNPASRMLIINGQVFHEGDALAPDLTLEQIKLKTAVLRYKGYRYGISY